MGSFQGHLVPGTLFLVIGVWHTWSSVVRYVSNPKAFKIRVWSPVVGFGGRLKYMELYVVVVGSFIDLCIELLYSPHFRYFVNGVLNPSHMNDFAHSGMLLMFFIFGVVALLNEKTRYLPLPEGALILIIATAFLAEYLLFSNHSTSYKGLESYYHILLLLIISISIISILTATLFPTSFPLDLTCGISITLQGIWFYQIAFSLHGPMMPHGCNLKDNEIICKLPENEVRGELLANFQLFAAVLLVFVAVLGSYGFAASRYGSSELMSMHAATDGFEED
ncbi:uncharacterized protein LOC143883436 isoform X2 [Tasmannia lanceolata]|uniref:uncharacterized protein LOC143883436 isoform X2 n=1 Tax=Tasmannia lanceolata TaxID=3420 RepID=UPI004062BF71